MINRIKFLTSGKIVPGMVLAAPINEVVNHRWFTLPAETVLTELLIEHILKKGVECVVVHARDDTAVTPDQVRDIDQDMERLFLGHDTARSDIQELYDAILSFRLMKL